MAKLDLIPPGHRIVETSRGPMLEKKKRRRRRYKLSAKRRKQISAAAKRFKVPILTGAALAVPVADAINNSKNAGTFSEKIQLFAARMLENYTGIIVGPLGGGVVAFKPMSALRGLGPLGAVALASRFGLFRRLNNALARLKMPFRMS